MSLQSKRTLSNRISQLKVQLKEKNIIAQSWQDKEKIDNEIQEFLNVCIEDLKPTQLKKVLKGFLNTNDQDFREIMYEHFKLAQDKTDSKEDSVEHDIKEEVMEDDLKQEVESLSPEKLIPSTPTEDVINEDAANDEIIRFTDRWTPIDYQALIEAIETHGIDTD